MVQAGQLAREQDGVYRLTQPQVLAPKDKWAQMLEADQEVTELTVKKAVVRRIRRSQKLRDLLVNYYNARCLVCDISSPYSIPTDISGRFYVEVHHVKGLAEAYALQQGGTLVGMKVTPYKAHQQRSCLSTPKGSVTMDIHERRTELIHASDCDAVLRLLLSRGFMGFLADDNATTDFLELVYADAIKDHLEDRCNCDLTDGGYGYCYIAQWYEGCRPAWEVITELERDTFAAYFKEYFRSV